MVCCCRAPARRLATDRSPTAVGRHWPTRSPSTGPAPSPKDAQPLLPYFAYGRLWSGGESVALPAGVNAAVGPWAVEGGWIVMVGAGRGATLAWAMLSPDGGLRDLPAETYRGGLGDGALRRVAADGRQVATEKWLVDIGTMTATELPHSPASPDDGGYVTQVRPKGFTAQGLVYEAAPYDEGIGSTYLMRPDGSTVLVGLPDDTHIPDGSPGDVAVDYDYAADDSDTCVTSHRLRRGPVGRGRHRLHGEVPRRGAVDLAGRTVAGHRRPAPRSGTCRRGSSPRSTCPARSVTSRGVGLVGDIVWETADTVLAAGAPTARRWD